MTEKGIDKLQKLIAEYQRVMNDQVDLQKFTYYAITYHSTAIEGSTLTEGQVYNLLDLDMPAKNKPFSEQQMVIDHQKALVFTLNKVSGNESITENLIKEIGRIVVRNTGSVYNTAIGSFDSTKGDYRLLNVHSGARYFPNYQKVPALMKDFCKEINEKIASAKTFQEKCEAAFEAHFKFVSIHPFVDGNGRTSRLLMIYVLRKFNLPIFYVYKNNRLSYIQAIEKTRETGNNTFFYDFMYRQYQKFLESEIKKV